MLSWEGVGGGVGGGGGIEWGKTFGERRVRKGEIWSEIFAMEASHKFAKKVNYLSFGRACKISSLTSYIRCNVSSLG